MRLLQVVPALAADGVGSYAQRLDEAFAGQGIATALLAGDALPARTAEALETALERWWPAGGEPAGVLLHYAGYGYQERGCPAWLAAGTGRWLARGGGRRMATFFHEVNAFGPPWRSSFWLSPLQRRLAAALARRSAGIATTLELYREALHRWVPRRPVEVLPVFSTVGEPDEVPPLAARPRRLVVFGGPGTRRQAFQQRGEDLAAACRSFGIEEIVDVGPPAGPLPDEVAGRRVRRLGVLPGPAVRDLLLQTVSGFLVYPPSFLPKSTVFAAYCAHGVAPVCAPSPDRGDSLRAGRHYLLADPAGADPQEVANNARAWYMGHSLSRQMETFVRLVFGGPGLS